MTFALARDVRWDANVKIAPLAGREETVVKAARTPIFV